MARYILLNDIRLPGGGVAQPGELLDEAHGYKIASLRESGAALVLEGQFASLDTIAAAVRQRRGSGGRAPTEESIFLVATLIADLTARAGSVVESFSATVSVDRNALQTYSGTDNVNFINGGGHVNGFTKTYYFPANTATDVNFDSELNVTAATFDGTKGYLVQFTAIAGQVFGTARVISGADAAAPTLATAATNVAGTTITLTYNENLDESSVPLAAAFVLDGTTAVVQSLVINNTTVVLTVDPPVENGQTVTLDYTPGATPIRDRSGNAAAALDDEAVTNNVP